MTEDLLAALCLPGKLEWIQVLIKDKRENGGSILKLKHDLGESGTIIFLCHSDRVSGSHDAA
jgi:hypothetical protein